MRPPDGSQEPLPPEIRDAAVIPANRIQEARVLSPDSVPAGTLASVPGTPAELAGMLLPTEYVTFASSPHPVIFVRPIVAIVLICIALSVALSWQLYPVVRGHHVATPLLTSNPRVAALIFAALLVLREAIALAGRLFHFLAYRVVTTNRRVFIVEGLFGRRVRPLGNTALAGATMSQGPIGRMLNFGDLFLQGGDGPSAIRTIRDPVHLYHDFEAVAMGVEGDTWKQAIRQTQIP
jgi:hypothetical protein